MYWKQRIYTGGPNVVARIRKGPVGNICIAIACGVKRIYGTTMGRPLGSSNIGISEHNMLIPSFWVRVVVGFSFLITSKLQYLENARTRFDEAHWCSCLSKLKGREHIIFWFIDAINTRVGWNLWTSRVYLHFIDVVSMVSSWLAFDEVCWFLIFIEL